jgi:eukaryotic-like serine/threonine-protein kinase
VTPGSLLREIAQLGRETARSRPEMAVGERLGRFEIVGELGRGGMGVVYAAEDRALGRTVALKVVDDGGTDGGERSRRFVREARAAAAIAHPSIATIYDVGQEGSRTFIAMELVRGEPLRARLGGEPLPIQEVWRIARAVAEGLAHAHAAGVIHRDIKPENVMITTEGGVKLLDFGLAKHTSGRGLDDAQTRTEEGRTLGTPSYMSPEQAKGEAVGAPSDVFSLGVMLYEMATGQRPFKGRTRAALFIAAASEARVPPERLNPRVPRALSRVVLRCLEKDPGTRFEDGGELFTALSAVGSTDRRAVALTALAALVLMAVIAFAASALAPRLARETARPSSALPAVSAPPALVASASRPAVDANPPVPVSPTGPPVSSAPIAPRAPIPSPRAAAAPLVWPPDSPAPPRPSATEAPSGPAPKGRSAPASERALAPSAAHGSTRFPEIKDD